MILNHEEMIAVITAHKEGKVERLSGDKLIEIARQRFDYKDGFLYWKDFKGCVKTPGSRAGATRHHDYLTVSIAGKKYAAHRVIFGIYHGYIPDYIDHINGDRYDNRIENLREATPSNNNANTKLRKDNSSGVKGVSFHKASGLWRAEIAVSGKRLQLGYFKSIDDAKNAISSKRTELHGEFANHGCHRIPELDREVTLPEGVEL